jgi:fatty aldehyde decarbonylase
MPSLLQADPGTAAAHRGVYADILSQAITGELIGMQNYASMVPLYPQIADQEDAVAHANNERGHASAFRRAARDLGVEVIEDVRAPYWRRIREAFLEHVAAGDLTACLVVQELMLESFAVAMYHAVADVTSGKLGQVFRAIAEEEEGHLDHAIEELQDELHQNREQFEDKVGRLHDQVMTVLAEMLAAGDTAGHCGLCHGDCIKDSLPEISLSAPELRGRAISYYLKALDRLGVRGERSLAWVANLPA